MKVEANLPKLTMKEKLDILLQVIEKMSPEEVKDRINEVLLKEDNSPFKNYEELTKVLEK
jgi:hypothetical protein